MVYEIEYLESVLKEDLPRISSGDKKLIRVAIEKKLVRNPIVFGKPLQYSLKCSRRLRVGDYRIIFTIEEPNTVLVVKIGHRMEVYE